MQGFLNDIERGLRLMKAHPDFIAIALLALILGIGRAPGIASALSLRAAMARQPAIENFLPGLPAQFDVKALKQMPACEREFLVFRSY